MGKTKIDLKTPATRRRLHPYREPHWEKLPAAMTKSTSLGFRRSDKTGAETWHVRVRLDGKYYQANLGDVHPNFEYKNAYRKALEWAQVLRANGPTIKESFTLQDVMDDYLKKLQGNSSPRSLAKRDQAEMRLNALVPDTINKRQVNSITAREINNVRFDYQQRKNHQGTPISPESVNRAMTHLIAALNHGYRSSMIECRDAWKHYQRLPEEPHKRKVQEYISNEKRQEFINACPPCLKPFVQAMHYLGARPSEICRLKVTDVKLEPGFVELLTYKGTARVRTFPLPANSAIRMLFEAQVQGKEPDENVFTTSRGKPWTQANLAKAHKAVRETTGLTDNFDTYSWRHCRISDFVREGFPAPEVADATGTSLQYIEKNYYKTDSSIQSRMAMLT